jgi:hypothetical protein
VSEPWVRGTGLVAVLSRAEAKLAGPWNRLRFSIAAAAGSLCLALPCGAEWSVESHALLSSGWDSNPREWVQVEHRRGDVFNRLEWGLAFRRGRAIGLDVGWATERYLQEASENRHLLEVAGSYRWSADKHWTEVFAGGSARYFPQQDREDPELRGDRDVQRLKLGARGVRQQVLGAVLFWQAQLVGLEKEPLGEGSPGRSRRGGQAGGEWRWNWRSPWQALVLLEGSGIWHEQEAIGAPVAGMSPRLGSHRRDGSLGAGIGVTRSGSPSLRVTGAYQRTWSNSAGIAFERLRVDLSAGVLLPWRVSAHLLARWHPLSRYDDQARQLDPNADPDDPDDAEFEERNRVVLSLQRPLSDTFLLELQGGWHRNESGVPFADYEKTLVQIALRYGTAG